MMRQFVFAGLIIALTAMGSLAQGLGGFRNVEVKVLDEAGKPLQEATVGVNAADLDFPLSVDKEGIASLNLPNEAGLLVLKASCPGYVSLEVRWSAENIPQSFTFNMSKGQPIGGIVHDERGKPIKGVMVEGLLVSSRVAADGQVLPLVGGELAKTDAEGRWRADVATSEPLQLRLKLSHDDYYSDPSFGKRRVANDALRTLTHIEVLADRILPQGIVRNSSGTPVADARFYVIKAGESVTLENGRIKRGKIVGKPGGEPPEAACVSDAEGKFEFAYEKDDYTLLCLADAGWAIESSRLFAKNAPVNLKLTAWAGVRGVLTEDGKAVQGEKLSLAVHLDEMSTQTSQLQWNNRATTNDRGEFAFERLVNGFASLGAELEYCTDKEDSRQDYSIEAQTPLRPGDTTKVLLNRQGVIAKGIVIPLRYDSSEAAIICGVIELIREQEVADMVKKLFFDWGQAASIGMEFQPIDNAVRNAELLKNPPRPKYLAPVDAQGKFRFDHLPPGKYRATVHIRAEATDEFEEAWLTGHIWEAFPVAPAVDSKEKNVDLGLLEFEVYESEE